MPFKVTKDGLRINIRLAPKAKRDKIGDIVDIADGKKALKVAVNAIPEDGKANKALIALLAKQWKIPKTTMSLISGHTNKNKVLLIDGDGTDIKERILGLLSCL